MQSISNGTVEQRGKGRWRLRISVTFDNGESERLQRNVECRTKTDAKKMLDTWRMELKSDNPAVRRERLTLGEYLNEYLLYCRDDEELSASTIRGYRDIIENRLCGLTNMRLVDIKPYMLEEHYNKLRNVGGAAGRPLSGSSCQKAHSFLKTALKRAVILEYINTNPCDRISGPSKNNPQNSALTAEDVTRMLRLLKGHPDRRFAMACRLALATGMRRGEVCALRWQDIDLEKASIHVSHALVEAKKDDYPDGETLRLKDTKTDASDRRISLDSDTLDVLRRYKDDQFYALEYFDTKQTPETPVVAGSLGEWYRPSNFTKDFEAFKLQHGFGVRLHDLRHTQASLLIAAGIPIVTVSKRLGHAKVSTTLDIYSHMMPGQDEEAAEKIGNIFTTVACS